MLVFTLLWIFIPFAWSTIVIHDKDDTTPDPTFPTLDYFQIKYPYSERKNAMVVLARPLPGSTTCEYRNTSTERDLAAERNTDLSKYDSLVLFVTLNGFRKIGCVNIYQVVQNGQKYAQELQDELKYPPLTNVIIGMGRKLPKAVYGGPLTEPYSSRKFGMPDGKPPVETSFVQPEGAVAIAKALRDADEAHSVLTVDYAQESGPWNNMFMGVPFLIYNWTLLTLNAAVLLYGLYRLFLVVRDGELALDARTFTFLLAVVADIIFIVTLTMPHRTWWRILLEQVYTTLLFIAFLCLLLYWIRLMEGANLEYHATSFRIFLYTALVAGIGMNVNTVYGMLHIPTSSDLLRSAILEMLFICVQACIAAIFLYHGVMFIVHRRHAREGGQTEQTLLMLSYLALIGCASFVFTIMANKIAMNPDLFSVPGGYLMLWLFRTLGSTIRIAALLLIMSVRPPAMSRLSRAGSVRSMMTIKSTASTLVGGPETTKVSSWLSKRSEQRDKTDQS